MGVSLGAPVKKKPNSLQLQHTSTMASQVRITTYVNQCQERPELPIPISVYLEEVLLCVSMHVLSPRVQL